MPTSEAESGAILVVEIIAVALFTRVDVAVTTHGAAGSVIPVTAAVAGERPVGETHSQGLADIVDGIAVADIRTVDHTVAAGRAVRGVEHAVATTGERSRDESLGLAGLTVEIVGFALLCAFDEPVAAGVAPGGVVLAARVARERTAGVAVVRARSGSQFIPVTDFFVGFYAITAHIAIDGSDGAAAQVAPEFAAIETFVNAGSSIEVAAIAGFTRLDQPVAACWLDMGLDVGDRIANDRQR